MFAIAPTENEKYYRYDLAKKSNSEKTVEFADSTLEENFQVYNQLDS